MPHGLGSICRLNWEFFSEQKTSGMTSKKDLGHLPELTNKLGFTVDNIPYVDFLHLMEDAVKAQSR